MKKLVLFILWLCLFYAFNGYADCKKPYIVKGGDNLSTIAKRNHTTTKLLKEWNNKKTPKLNVGDHLCLSKPTIEKPKIEDTGATDLKPIEDDDIDDINDVTINKNTKQPQISEDQQDKKNSVLSKEISLLKMKNKKLINELNQLKKEPNPIPSKKTNRTLEISLLILAILSFCALCLLIYDNWKRDKTKGQENEMASGIRAVYELLRKNIQLSKEHKAQLMALPKNTPAEELNANIKELTIKFNDIEIHQQDHLAQIRQENNQLNQLNNRQAKEITELKTELGLLSEETLTRKYKNKKRQLERMMIGVFSLAKRIKIDSTSIPKELNQIEQTEWLMDAINSDLKDKAQEWNAYSKNNQIQMKEIEQAVADLIQQTTINTSFNSNNLPQTLKEITENIKTIESNLAEISLKKEDVKKQAEKVMEVVQPQVSQDILLTFETLPEQLDDLFKQTQKDKEHKKQQEADKKHLLIEWKENKTILENFNFTEINQALNKLETDFIDKSASEIQDWYQFNEILAHLEEILYWHEWLILPLDETFINTLGHLLELTKALSVQNRFCIYKYPLDKVEGHQKAHSFNEVMQKLQPLCQDQGFEITELITQNILDLLFIIDKIGITDNNKKTLLINLFGEQGTLLELPSSSNIQSKRIKRKRIYRFDALSIHLIEKGKKATEMTTQRY